MAADISQPNDKDDFEFLTDISMGEAMLYGGGAGAVGLGATGVVLGGVFGLVAMPIGGAWGGYELSQQFFQAAGTSVTFLTTALGFAAGVAINNIPIGQKTTTKTTTTYQTGTRTVEPQEDGRLFVRPEDFSELTKKVEEEKTVSPRTLDDLVGGMTAIFCGAGGAVVGSIVGVTSGIACKGIANIIQDVKFSRIKGELKAAMEEELRKPLPVYVPTHEVEPKGRDKPASLTPSNNPVSQPCYRRQDYFGNTLH